MVRGNVPCVSHAADEPVSVVRFEPVALHPRNVHHITVFGCGADVEKKNRVNPHFGGKCASWAFASGQDAPCRVVVGHRLNTHTHPRTHTRTRTHTHTPTHTHTHTHARAPPVRLDT